MVCFSLLSRAGLRALRFAESIGYGKEDAMRMAQETEKSQQEIDEYKARVMRTLVRYFLLSVKAFIMAGATLCALLTTWENDSRAWTVLAVPIMMYDVKYTLKFLGYSSCRWLYAIHLLSVHATSMWPRDQAEWKIVFVAAVLSAVLFGDILFAKLIYAVLTMAIWLKRRNQ